MSGVFPFIMYYNIDQIRYGLKILVHHVPISIFFCMDHGIKQLQLALKTYVKQRHLEVHLLASQKQLTKPHQYLVKGKEEKVKNFPQLTDGGTPENCKEHDKVLIKEISK